MTELERLCEANNVRLTSKYVTTTKQDGWDCHEYKVTLRYGRRQYTTTFYQGMAHTSDPDAAGVLYCLCSDARSGEMSFDDFCSELGYDNDSRKAEATWKACKRASVKVRALLGSDFDIFANAEH